MKIDVSLKYTFYIDSVECIIEQNPYNNESIYHTFINGKWTNYKTGYFEDAVDHLLKEIGISKEERKKLVKNIQIQ